MNIIEIWTFHSTNINTFHVFVITVRNSSCRKVMFSQACVKNSVHGGGRGVHPWTHTHTPILDTHTHGHKLPPPPDTHTHTHPWTLPSGHTHPLDTPYGHTHTLDTCPLSPQDGHCIGRYASYWNALFLLRKIDVEKRCEKISWSWP